MPSGDPWLKGEQLIKEGDRAKRVFVLISGKLAVLSKKQPIAEVLPGEPIENWPFLQEGCAPSDVVAARDSEVLQLDRPAYDALAQAIPEIGDQILTVLARRMAAAIEHVAPLPPRGSTTVAIVPRRLTSSRQRFPGNAQRDGNRRFPNRGQGTG